MIKFKSPIEPGVLRTPWVYFDGSAEEIVADKIGDERDDWIPPDICGVFVGNEEPDDAIEICDRGRAILPVGEYPVLVYEEPARAFIWENDRDFVVPLIVEWIKSNV